MRRIIERVVTVVTTTTWTISWKEDPPPSSTEVDSIPQPQDSADTFQTTQLVSKAKEVEETEELNIDSSNIEP